MRTHILTEADRRAPTVFTAERLRQRFPTEPAIDRVLTRKLERRSEGGYRPVALDTLAAGADALIHARLGYPAPVENARWLSGGASKLQMVFDLRWRGFDGTEAEQVVPLVLRMEPAASITESSRRREFEVLKAIEGTIPAPKPYWVDEDAEFLPYPGMIYSFARGAAKPSTDAGKVTGLGQNYGPALRAKLAPDFVGLLARLHTIDTADCPSLESFTPAHVGANASIVRQVNAMRRLWEEDRLEEEPVMEIVYQWLVAHAPPLDHVSIVHGDYRSGNFLFDEQEGRISAWLDWENAVLGDRHQDLAYATHPTFRHIAEDGSTVLCSGLMEEQDFYAAYEAASGLKVDPERLRYFRIYNRYLVCVLTLGAAARAAVSAGTHQDVLVNFVATMGYSALEDLRVHIAEALA